MLDAGWVGRVRTMKSQKPKKAVTVRSDQKLTPKQLRFVQEYMIDLNGTQAAIRAGYSAKTANEQAAQLLAKLSIQAAISGEREKQQERTEITADRVLREAWSILTADARELVQVKVGCCRHCWGEGHRYQRTVAEYNYDHAEWLAKHQARKTEEDFEEQGGIGYNPLRAPHPECPECCGDGYSRVVLADTRKISPAAAALYAGAEQTKYGLKVVMHDKVAAMEKLFKHLGLYEKDNEQKTDPLTALLQSISGANASAFRPVAHDPEATPTSAFEPQPGDDPGDD